MSIEVRHITKRFGDFVALNDVSLSIPSGELVALLGPSGCGKTTLLRIIAGMETADEGQVFFSGSETTNVPARERGVGFVFQHYALFPHMTIAQNIAFGLKVSKVKREKAAVDARVAELLRLVRLDGLGDRFPAQISGGQRQRVALARALAVDPKVLLLDEPFGALDANVRRDLRRWLREIHSELGITTLFVTHDQEEALDLADRVVVLKDGQIVQQGTPGEVCRDPKSAFVMRFLGDTNVIAADVRDGTALVGDVAIEASGLPNGKAEIHARPADLIWSNEGPGIPAHVGRVLDRVDGRRVLVTTRNEEQLEFDVEPERAIEAGENGFVQFRRAKVFPA